MTNYITDEEIIKAYQEEGTLHKLASRLGISYPTAVSWTTDIGIKLNRQGYNSPSHDFTNLQCRHAREFLKMTRDDFCSLSKVSKTALREFELGKANIRRETANKILAAFEVMGIRFNADGTFSHGQSTPRDCVKN